MKIKANTLYREDTLRENFNYFISFGDIEGPNTLIYRLKFPHRLQIYTPHYYYLIGPSHMNADYEQHKGTGFQFKNSFYHSREVALKVADKVCPLFTEIINSVDTDSVLNSSQVDWQNFFESVGYEERDSLEQIKSVCMDLVLLTWANSKQANRK